jgi:hypothetical protein
MIDRHIAATRARLELELGSQDRARELSMTSDPEPRFKLAALNYSVRALYAELSNIEQLRDEISRCTGQGIPSTPMDRRC